MLPDWQTSVRENRWFLGRAVRYLTVEAGIPQFLDIGPGLPAAGATHEVAQAIAPEARVAYVDNDPMVITHARTILTSAPEWACAYIHADLRDPEKILTAAADVLDFSQPLAPGSYLVLSHLTRDHDPVRVAKSMKVGDDVGIPVRSVTLEESGEYFTGLELLNPGAVLVSEWRRDVPARSRFPQRSNFYGAVARK